MSAVNKKNKLTKAIAEEMSFYPYLKNKTDENDFVTSTFIFTPVF